MLTPDELQQICRVYKLTCPVCQTETEHHRLKRDMARPVKTAGDGYPLLYKWQKPGFDSVDPKQFLMGVCPKCGFAGELDDAEFRQAGRSMETFLRNYDEKALQAFKDGAATGKGAAQSLLKRATDDEPLLAAIAKVHLGILSQCARSKLSPGPSARLYLRVAWLFRDLERFYGGSDLEAIAASMRKCRSRWKKDLPPHDDYPLAPAVVLDEIEALRQARGCFERNYETLREAGPEDELRLRYLLAEIGFRLYELSDDPDDHKKAATFFSGTMQQCLGIISDKSIVGGLVNRAKETLQVAGDRGRELRALHKERGGGEARSEAKADDAPSRGQAGKAKAKTKAKTKAGRSSGRPMAATVSQGQGVKGNGAESPGAALEEDLAGSERDRMTRQITILTGEVDKLKTRLEELEADNKKWRQMVGRDGLTGLPNKISLFRIQLPKVLREFASAGPISCIAIGLDQLGRVNQTCGWMMGDKMLRASARGLRKFLQDGDELYRMDGANFCIAGPMNINAARLRAAELRRALSGSTVRVDDTTMPLAASLGVVSIEQRGTGSESDIANAVYAALLKRLYGAKTKGGNTVEIHNVTRF